MNDRTTEHLETFVQHASGEPYLHHQAALRAVLFFHLPGAWPVAIAANIPAGITDS